MDTTVCDTLLPFRWEFADTAVVFAQVGEQTLSILHPKWKDCTDRIYTLTLDTVFCEKLYDLLINKYNWLIMCDNTRLAEYFPEQQATEYKWYKNGVLVPEATTDDYSENAELNGEYQLQVTLNGDKKVKSNVLSIHASGKAPKRIVCYNELRLAVSPDIPLEQLPAGIYVVVYQYGEEIRTEKVFVR